MPVHAKGQDGGGDEQCAAGRHVGRVDRDVLRAEHGPGPKPDLGEDERLRARFHPGEQPRRFRGLQLFEETRGLGRMPLQESGGQLPGSLPPGR